MPSKKNISKSKGESSKEEESKVESSEEEQMEWRDLTRPEKKMLGTWRFVSHSHKNSSHLFCSSSVSEILTMAFLVVAASSAFFNGINMAIADVAEEN